MFDVDGDGLPEDVYYNGFRAGVDRRRAGRRRALREREDLVSKPWRPPCVQGRAVMIDLEAHFGATGKIVGYDDLRRVLEQDRVEVEPGDFVCLRTGFAERLLEMRKQPDPDRLQATSVALDGRDEALLDWITQTGLVALIADNYAVEAHPARACNEARCASLPLHAHCLFRLGVFLGEMLVLDRACGLVAREWSQPLLADRPAIAPPGAVGSPATPVGDRLTGSTIGSRMRLVEHRP